MPTQHDGFIGQTQKLASNTSNQGFKIAIRKISAPYRPTKQRIPDDCSATGMINKNHMARRMTRKMPHLNIMP
ncbi:hypothetical protein AA3271_2123 [Gluconobacter japonicus NBRC 3271]|nr:hypothetical protein AA3271_2123 [Gluconobacter japonicus NBRC 3271]